ncbi:MAG TPA: DUF480 domain-containing protein [Solirubrobacteraceae bacterium]|nr:DUF480 domain-containing protein [Solirubrobacteraceae bacterium]
MHFSALTPAEQRVFGCLIEKRFTTPDAYPLSLNALRLAANQSTNRDPVMHLEEGEVNDAAQRLSRYGLVRLASGHGSRAVKYRHLAEDALDLRGGELALLCVLLLRGPQTPGELKARTERMAAFGSLAQVDAGLEALSARGYVRRLDRRPGQKEERWAQLLGADALADPAAGGRTDRPTAALAGTPAHAVASPPAPPVASGLGAAPAPPAACETGPAPPVVVPQATALSALEARVAALEAEVAELREALGG